MNTCTKCGATNTPEAFSCGNCGAPLRGHALNHSGDVNTQALGRLAPVGAGASEKESSFDFSVIAAKIIQVAVVLAIVGAALWWFVLRSTPDIAASKFIKSAAKQDMKTFMNSMTAASQQLIPAEQAQMAANMVGATQNAEVTVKVTDVKINGNAASGMVTVEVKAQGSDKPVTQNPQNFLFVKEGGKWKVDLRGMLVQQFRNAAQQNPGQVAVFKSVMMKQLGTNPATRTAWEGVFKEATGF